MTLKEEQQNPRGSKYILGPRILDHRWVLKHCLWVREMLSWVLHLKEWLTSSHYSASQDMKWGRQGGR